MARFVLTVHMEVADRDADLAEDWLRQAAAVVEVDRVATQVVTTIIERLADEPAVQPASKPDGAEAADQRPEGRGDADVSGADGELAGSAGEVTEERPKRRRKAGTDVSGV